MNKKFGLHTCCFTDQLINQRYFFMYFIKIKVIGQGNMAIDMQFVTIPLRSEIVEVDLLNSAFIVQYRQNFLHKLKIGFVHQP